MYKIAAFGVDTLGLSTKLSIRLATLPIRIDPLARSQSSTLQVKTKKRNLQGRTAFITETTFIFPTAAFKTKEEKNIQMSVNAPAPT